MKKGIVVGLAMVVVLMLVACGNSNREEGSIGSGSQMTENEIDEQSTIEGAVLEINENNILINQSGYENGECYLTISDGTVIYINGERADSSMIEIGQTIKATYTGGIEEIYPGRINEVIEITITEGETGHAEMYFTEEQIEEAKQAALAYYEDTVFTVNSIEYFAGDSPYGGGDDCYNFIVGISKDGVMQEPGRTISLQLNNGIWEVVNEGY